MEPHSTPCRAGPRPDSPSALNGLPTHLTVSRSALGLEASRSVLGIAFTLEFSLRLAQHVLLWLGVVEPSTDQRYESVVMAAGIGLACVDGVPAGATGSGGLTAGLRPCAWSCHTMNSNT